MPKASCKLPYLPSNQAHRFRFKHADIKDLELQLQEADKKGARVKMIATDGKP
jgi:7-keto-8-aminopelargonate synthetase-like enzyme